MHTAIPGEIPSEKNTVAETNPYESDRLVHEYLLFHYGSAEEVLPFPEGPRGALGFPVRCVREGFDWERAVGGRALDLGCAVGRSSFELSRECSEVVGIDYSSAFVRAAERIRVEGRVEYERREEGERTTRLVAGLPEGSVAERIRFEVGDAQALRGDLGEFDVVLMANLIDRLRDPQRCLSGLGGLVRSGGQLLVTSPYTWMEEFTPKSAWLGGVREVEGGEVGRGSTLEGLKRSLEGEFELAGVRNFPFLIREHARKYQWSVAEGSLWIRR
jgi:putative 4-mercaptohistidine N1-methyltranferase